MSIIKDIDAKTVLTTTVTALVLVLSLGLTYTLLAATGETKMSWEVYGLFLLLINILNVLFFYAVWQERERYTFRFFLGVMLWTAMSSWFWVLTPIYFYLVMNVTEVQLAWMSFFFLWQVPVVASVIFVTCTLVLGRRMISFMDDGRLTLSYRDLQREIDYFPWVVAALAVLITTLAFGLCFFQLRLFVNIPVLEQMKGQFGGLVIAFPFAAFVGFLLVRFLQRVYRTLEERVSSDEFSASFLLHNKLFLAFGFLTVGAIMFFGVGGLQYAQGVLESSRTAIMEQNLDIVEEQAARGDVRDYAELNNIFRWQDRDYLAVTNELYLNSILFPSFYSAETRAYVEENERGVIIDRRLENQMISFVKLPYSDDIFISINYLPSHFLGWVNSQLYNYLFTLLVISTLVVVVGVMIILIISQSLKKLTNFINQSRVDEAPLQLDLFSGDELEELRHGIYYFVHTAKELKENLEEKVQKQTRQLEEAALQQERARKVNAAILEYIGDGLITTDKNGRISSINNAAERVLGWKSEDIEEKPVDEVMPIVVQEKQESRPVKMEHPLLKALEQNTRVSSHIDKYTYYMTNKKGEQFPVAFSATAVILEGKIIAGVQVFRDITKEVMMDKAKTEFVSLASHQLRTPPSTINWYSELLLDLELDDEQTQYVNEIFEASKRMVRMVNALLNASRIEMGALAVSPEPVNLVVLIDNVIGQLAPQIQEKHLQVEKNYPEVGHLPEIKLDSNLMEVVFNNLIENSIKYTPEGGSISVTVEKGEGEAVIHVVDTGYGIPEDSQNQLFTKFFRAENVQKKDTTGTGLGLYLVKSIVDLTGGEITVHSREGEGCRFTVHIPFSGMQRQEGRKSLENPL